jgi:hypothetical protein
MVGRGVECQAMATKHRALQSVHDSGDRSFGPQRAARGCRLLCAGFANAWAAHRAIRIYSCRGKFARSACLPTAHWKGRNRSMVQHGSGNVSPAQSPLLLSSAGTSLASALLLTLSFIPGAPPCRRCHRRRQRLRLCPGSQPPNGRFGLLP